MEGSHQFCPVLEGSTNVRRTVTLIDANYFNQRWPDKCALLHTLHANSLPRILLAAPVDQEDENGPKLSLENQQDRRPSAHFPNAFSTATTNVATCRRSTNAGRPPIAGLNHG
ncbi:unnamed protein product [Schistocephalus solidus]|uniref:Uncharacterized protein n=1 Tax=Schistocephalus solidus TaxID=70667 RepID=A0A183TIS2_SCHSO|nr:unnamed protein product [Schistocephalus solidus]